MIKNGMKLCPLFLRPTMEKINIAKPYLENEETINAMKQAYLDSPKAIKHLNSIGVDQELAFKNIAKVYDFVSDLNYCSNCPGMKNCQKNNPLLCVKIVNKSGMVDRQLVPCKEYLKYINYKNQFTVMDFDEKWLEDDLKNIDKTDRRADAIKLMLNYAAGKSNDWIYLIGGPGTGRSYLAAMMANKLAKDNKGPICFINASKRFKELNDYNYKDSVKFDNILRNYSTCPILIIDDFGNEVKNDVVRDGVLLQILNARASKRLFTIFTSDFSIDEIVDLYSTSKAATPRANQIGKIIKGFAKEEINLGDISLY